MDEYIEECTIRDAIADIREKRHRPDKESIARFIISKHGLTMEAILNTVDRMLENGSITNKKTSNDEDSFYVANEIVKGSNKEKTGQICNPESRKKAVCNSKTPSVNSKQKEASIDTTTPKTPKKTNESILIGESSTDLSNWANAVTSMMGNISLLNNLLQEERRKSSNLLEENYYLKMKIQAMETKLDTIVLEKNENNMRQENECSITKEIRSQLINEAERHTEATKDDSSRTKASSKSSKSQTSNRNKKQMSEKTTQGRKQSNQNTETTQRAQGQGEKSKCQENEEKKLKVLIAGDSQLRRINASVLSNSYRDVDIKFKPGMKIEQTTKAVGKTEHDIIIIHAATNNIASKTPEQLSKEVVNQLKHVQDNNPKARIVFSSVIRRKDDSSLNSKVTKLNKLLEDETALNGFDMIDNSNIVFSNLWTDGLHINDGGVRKLSGNYSKFIKYC